MRRHDGRIHSEDVTPAERLNRLFADQAQAVDAQQRASVLRWQSRDERFYEQVRSVTLGSGGSAEAMATADDLQDLMSDLPEDVQSWRGVRDVMRTFGVSMDHIEVLIGVPKESPVFLATSVERTVAETEFTQPGRNPALLKVLARAGTPAVWIPPLGALEEAYQCELLFPPGVVVTILDVDRTQRVPVVGLEVSDGEVG